MHDRNRDKAAGDQETPGSSTTADDDYSTSSSELRETSAIQTLYGWLAISEHGADEAWLACSTSMEVRP